MNEIMTTNKLPWQTLESLAKTTSGVRAQLDGRAAQCNEPATEPTRETNMHQHTNIKNLITQATGPLTQATGPPWSDAGVGIGMLWGISLLSAN